MKSVFLLMHFLNQLFSFKQYASLYSVLMCKEISDCNRLVLTKIKFVPKILIKNIQHTFNQIHILVTGKKKFENAEV
jgi:hypothetical protein